MLFFWKKVNEINDLAPKQVTYIYRYHVFSDGLTTASRKAVSKVAVPTVKSAAGMPARAVVGS